MTNLMAERGSSSDWITMGEDRVWFQDTKDGHLHSLPINWTDVGVLDPFVAVEAGQSFGWRT
jgi:hypothetical protein